MENIQDGVDSALKVSQTQFSRQWFTFSVSRREGGGVEVAGSDEIDLSSHCEVYIVITELPKTMFHKASQSKLH